jgi:hypothetical protein
VAAEASGAQLVQHLVRGAVATLAGSFRLTAGDFSADTCCPAREAGNVLALVGEMSSPQLFRFCK